MHRAIFETITWAAALGIVAPASLASVQPTTTILTHGFSAGSKGVWVQGMADAVLARAGSGSCYRYNEASGLWQFVALPHGDDSTIHLVLIFNWQPESAGVSAGPNWNYVQAAADAMYVALREAHYGNPQNDPPVDLVSGRAVHFIGHSRGTCVNSEAVHRLAWAGIPVDQVTTHDPHPVNGSLDPPYDFDWGDPTPVKWTNVAWADNYWRADGGGFIPGLNFDGISLPDTFNTLLSESALNSGGYGQSHSDVHLWYHGTIDTSASAHDGEQGITAAMRTSWYPQGYLQRGYFYSVIGGGSPQRPAGQPAGTLPADPGMIFNGDFEQATYAGWTYHGGSVGGSIVNESGVTYLKLGAGTPGSSASHNRFFLPATASDVQFDYRVITAAADESLRTSLVDFAGNAFVVEDVPLAVAGNWMTNHSAPIACSVPRNRLYRLTFQIINAVGSQTGTAGIDNVRINANGPVFPADINVDGLVNIDDLLSVINSWGAIGANPADVNHDNVVNIDDLLAVINAWGPCS